MRNNINPDANKIAVVSALRSPIGKIPGAFTFIDDVTLLATVFRESAKGLESLIDEVVTGSSFPGERDNLSRKAALLAGIPSNVPCFTVSKTCASSDEALHIARDRIMTGKAKVVLVGGCEKVSTSPYILHFMKKNVKSAMKGTLPLYNDIKESIQENDMVYWGEKIAKEKGISREEQDCYTLLSYRKALAAHSRNCFASEMVKIDTSNQPLCQDELLLDKENEDVIRHASPMFIKDGTLTQYNAAPMCDCAAAIVLCDKETLVKAKITPIAWLYDLLSIGVLKEKAGFVMEECVERILRNNNLKKNDIGLYEINESFAVQAISTIRGLGLAPENVNVNGGNLALGYPVGTTGLRMAVTLVHEMQRSGTQFGLNVMCSGSCMANSALFSIE